MEVFRNGYSSLLAKYTPLTMADITNNPNASHMDIKTKLKNEATSNTSANLLIIQTLMARETPFKIAIRKKKPRAARIWPLNRLTTAAMKLAPVAINATSAINDLTMLKP